MNWIFLVNLNIFVELIFCLHEQNFSKICGKSTKTIFNRSSNRIGPISSVECREFEKIKEQSEILLEKIIRLENKEIKEAEIRKRKT